MRSNNAVRSSDEACGSLNPPRTGGRNHVTHLIPEACAEWLVVGACVFGLETTGLIGHYPKLLTSVTPNWPTKLGAHECWTHCMNSGSLGADTEI